MLHRFDGRPPDARPLILAHRGASASAPENTRRALHLAAAAGADGVETDLRTTRDGIVVLHHDPTLDGLGPIADHRFEDLRRHAPDLAVIDDLLDLPDRMILNLEIKNGPRSPGRIPPAEAAARVIAWVGEHRLEDRCLITSFDLDTVDAVAEGSRIATGRVLNLFDRLPSGLAGVAESGHEYVLPHRLRLRYGPARRVAAAAGHGLGVIAWTVNAPQELRRLAAAGVAGVITDDPAGALDVLTGR